MMVFFQGYAARGDSIVIVRCVQSRLSAPRDADTASGGMRTLRVRSLWSKKKKHHTRWCFFFLVHLQGFEPGTH